MLRAIDNISDSVGKIISFAVPIMIVIIILEIVLRGVFNHPTIWVHTTSAFLFGSYVMLGGAYCLRKDSHVYVDILVSRFSIRPQAILKLITAVFLFTFAGVIMWYGGDLAWKSFQNREFVDGAWSPPLYPYKFVIAFSAFLIVLQGLAEFIRNLMIACGWRKSA